MTEKTKSALRVVVDNHKRFTSDTEYINGLKAIDHRKLAAATAGLREKIAILVNYYVLIRNMTSIKIARGSLSDAAEQNLITRGKEAVNLFQDICNSFSAIGQAISGTGLETAIDRHIENVCQHLNYNPTVLAYLQDLKDMGITDGEITCVSEELKKINFNLLKYGGANGTFAGFIESLVSLNAPFQAEYKLMEQYGLPTIQGAGGSAGSTTVGVAVTVAILAGILCIITVFYL